MRKIKIIGVGGGGCNIVSYLSDKIDGVDFILCDREKVEVDSDHVKFLPLSALMNDKGVLQLLADGTEVVVLVACLGGVAGSDGVPIIARIAGEMGIKIVSMLTVPLLMEGRLRTEKAEHAVKEMLNYSSFLLRLHNECLMKYYGESPFFLGMRAVNELMRIVVSDVFLKHRVCDAEYFQRLLSGKAVGDKVNCFLGDMAEIFVRKENGLQHYFVSDEKKEEYNGTRLSLEACLEELAKENFIS